MATFVRKMRNKLTIILTLALSLAGIWIPESKAQNSKVMLYEVVGRDTIYIDELPPAVIHPRQYMKKKEWKQYYQRVHNFSKAYPYALFVSAKIKETDSLFEARGYNRRQRDKYLNRLKDELLREFEPIFRTLTLKQGLMMIRLIDRECGLTPYYILKHYLGGASAGFWQGIAKLFKGNLKQPYDRFGEDKDLEELVAIWQRGEYPSFYFWIFGKPMPHIIVPDRYRALFESSQQSSK